MGDTARILPLTLALCAIGSFAACGKEPPPPSVNDFMEDPILLDATMVRCLANRNSVSYDAECVNAREAVERIATAAERARREELEAESERKREAVRRAQEAADENRRQAAEAERLRAEAEYLGLLPATPQETPPDADELSFFDVQDGAGAATVTVQEVEAPAEGMPGGAGTVGPSAAGAEAPAMSTDLDAIREELEERQEAAPPESSD